MKYMRGMKSVLAKQIVEPHEEFVGWLSKKVHGGRFTAAQKERFTPMVAREFREFLNDRISQAAKSILYRDDSEESDGGQDEIEEADSGIVTTVLEIEGYAIVKSELRSVVDVARVHMIDRKSFCGVYFDGKNNKPICRLYFNNETRLQLGIPTVENGSGEVKHLIESIDGIYGHGDALREVVGRYVEVDEGVVEKQHSDSIAEGTTW